MTKVRSFFLVLIILCLATTLAAQDQKVLLKNGSLLRGQIETFNNGTISLRIDSASVIILQASSIAKIGFRPKKTTLSNRIVKQIEALNNSQNKVEYYHQLRFGLLNGEDANFFRRLSTLSMDYTFYRKSEGLLHTGVGVALDYYTSFVSLPVFFEFRHDFSHKPTHLFLYTRLGYARAKAREELTGNFGKVIGKEMWTLGIGHEWPLGKSHLMISAGFRQQNLNSVLEFQDFRSETDWQLKRLDFKIGLRF